MQRVTFPITLPAYAYKVLVPAEGGDAYRYGAMGYELDRSKVEFHNLEGLAAQVIEHSLHLSDMPDTEEIPDAFCDLGIQEWDELNELIERLADRGSFQAVLSSSDI